MTSYVSLEDLLTLAGYLGVGPVRDIGLLDAAVLGGSGVGVAGEDLRVANWHPGIRRVGDGGAPQHVWAEAHLQKLLADGPPVPRWGVRQAVK